MSYGTWYRSTGFLKTCFYKTLDCFNYRKLETTSACFSFCCTQSDELWTLDVFAVGSHKVVYMHQGYQFSIWKFSKMFKNRNFEIHIFRTRTNYWAIVVSIPLELYINFVTVKRNWLQVSGFQYICVWSWYSYQILCFHRCRNFCISKMFHVFQIDFYEENTILHNAAFSTDKQDSELYITIFSEHETHLIFL